MKKARKKKVVAPEDKPLRPKEKLFCDEYLIDLNGARAAREAGYAKNSARITASQLLTKPNVDKYIQSKSDKRSRRTEINQDYVLSTIQETIERSRQRVEPKLKNGLPVVIEDEENGGFAMAFQFDSNAILKGSELLGRHLKMFTDKVEHSGSIDLSGKTDKEIEEIINAT